MGGYETEDDQKYQMDSFLISMKSRCFFVDRFCHTQTKLLVRRGLKIWRKQKGTNNSTEIWFEKFMYDFTLIFTQRVL